MAVIGVSIGTIWRKALEHRANYVAGCHTTLDLKNYMAGHSLDVHKKPANPGVEGRARGGSRRSAVYKAGYADFRAELGSISSSRKVGDH